MATPKGDQTLPKTRELHLPISRVKTIMKSSPEVEAVGPEPLYLVAKVTEMFIIDLAKRALKISTGNTLDYKNVAEIVQEDDTLDFLREIVPRKVTVREYKAMLAKRGARGSASEDESTEESSEEESSEESTSESNATPQ